MKKRIGILTAVLMFLVIAASCGSGSTGSESAEPEEEVVVDGVLVVVGVSGFCEVEATLSFIILPAQ